MYCIFTPILQRVASMRRMQGSQEDETHLPLHPSLSIRVEEITGNIAFPNATPDKDNPNANGRSLTKYSVITTTLEVHVSPAPKPV